MHTQVTINLPCKSLPVSKAFYEALGYVFDPHFASPVSELMALNASTQVMLLTTELAQSLTPKTVVDAKQATESWVTLSCDSAEALAALIAKARAAGAEADPEPCDEGFMLAQGFADPDGHHWQLVYLRNPPA